MIKDPFTIHLHGGFGTAPKATDLLSVLQMKNVSLEMI